jgi:PAS domain S-box-containing protein
MGNDQEQHQPTAAELRRRAEAQLKTRAPQPTSFGAAAETERLLHELQVHQIELEMQNGELRQARDETEAALERYTDLFDFAPVGYLTITPAGVINAANLSGASLLGVERSRLLGRRLEQFVSEDGRRVFAEFIGKMFAHQGKDSCEVKLTPEGPPPLFARIEALTCQAGRECRLAVIDISRRKQLEEKLDLLYADLAARAAELETANTELEAFSYTVSHDLRNPLAAINSYCQVVQDVCGNRLDEQCRGYIREIYDGTLRMNRFIDTMLDFARITRVELKRSQVDLSSMAQEVTLGLRAAEPARRVTARIAAGIVAVGDADLLRVLLDNLIGNAWKYTRQREEAVIEFGATEVAGNPAWYVRDNGLGFDMALAGKLFQPFHRLSGTGVEGHGIGLATVERIARRHGGRVWAEGAPDRGATFFFTLE